MKEQKNQHGFARYYSPLDIWGIAFGVMVGWGAFVMPGTTFLPVAGPFGTLIALAVSVLIMLVIGKNYSFLMNRRPGIGGVYSYTKEVFGRDHAFLCSWFLCLSYLTIVFLNSTALFIVVQTVFDDLLQKTYRYTIAGNDIYLGEVAVSIAVLAIIGLLFIKAKPFLQKFHTILAVILLVGSVVIAAFCLPHLQMGQLAGGAFGIVEGSGVFGIFSIMILSPWAFVGFDVICLETAHFRFPIKRSDRIIRISILLGGFVYAAMALVSVSMVPEGFTSWQEYISSLNTLDGVASVPVFYIVRETMGTVGLVIAGITALAAILTGIIGAYRATTRVLSTMAEDHILSEKFSGTTYSILFIMGISIVISFLGRNSLNWFVELTSFGAIVGFGYTSAAAWKIARTENNRKIRITSMIGTLITAAFVIVELIPKLTIMETMNAEAFLLLSLWCLLGFVFYWRTVKHSKLSQYSGISTSGVILFALLLYSALMWFAKRMIVAQNMEQVKRNLIINGLILFLIVFVGLAVMLYIQNLVRKKHEASERDKIRAVESSLAKSQFLFNMSHDIRTPMNAIIGYTNLARKEKISPEAAGYLDKIDASSQHLLSLINDILEMSRIESGRLELSLEPADLGKILEEIRDLFSEQMKEKDLDFTVHTSQVQDPWVWCDRKNLNRVLLNIISNAYKFTPEGGSITASIWEIAMSDEGYGSYELRIRDSGIGMSTEFAEKMFNAFERERSSTDSGVEGTGLGLAITKSIIDAMGGTIDVITSPGSGTEFIIRLKFRLATEEELNDHRSEVSAQIAEQEVDFSTKRLLLAEDNEINREIATLLLSEVGFTIETAENGLIALNMVAASEPGYYDAVLMDIQMPEMDGYEATRAIRALEDPLLASIPILAMTANAFKEDEQAAMEAGMQAHIAKPLDMDKMLETLSRVLKESDNNPAVR